MVHIAERRRHSCIGLLIVAAAMLLGPAPSGAQPPEAELVVSYIEAPVGRGGVERSVEAYAAALAAGPGGPRVEVLREVGRPDRSVVIERWPRSGGSDEGALQRALSGRLQAPIDRRTHRPLGELLGARVTGPFHMLMHVDVAPVGAAMAAKALDEQRAAVMAAPGGRGYEAATQSDRVNHFAVHQVWASRAAYEAYIATAPAQELRRQLATAKGAVYDDRFYVAVPVRRRGR